MHACTQTHTEGQIYVKCTLFWDKNQTKTQVVAVNTTKISKHNLKKSDENHSVQHPQIISKWIRTQLKQTYEQFKQTVN